MPNYNLPPDCEKWVTNTTEGTWSERALRMYRDLYPDLEFSVGAPNDTFMFTRAELQEKGVVGIYVRRKHG